MYAIKQCVYTIKETCSVPAEQRGRIAAYIKVGKDLNDVLYEVAFDHGYVNIKHKDLKL